MSKLRLRLEAGWPPFDIGGLPELDSVGVTCSFRPLFVEKPFQLEATKIQNLCYHYPDREKAGNNFMYLRPPPVPHLCLAWFLSGAVYFNICTYMIWSYGYH